MDLFINHLYLFSVPLTGFAVINKTFPGSLGSLAKFSMLPRPNSPTMRHA